MERTTWRALVLCLLALGCQAAWAADPGAGQPAGASVQPPADEDEAVPFGMLRDPFWPIGWRPPDFGKVTNVAGEDRSGIIKWNEAEKLLSLSGITKSASGKDMAVIKGAGIVEEGDTIAVTYRGLVYKWKVRKITRDGVVPDRVGVYPVK